MNIGKNNITKKIFKESQRKPHFGIRKLSVGIASVLLSTTLLFGVASEVTPSFSLGLASVYAEEQLTYENATEDDYRSHFPSLSDNGIKKFMYYCQQVIPEIKDTGNGKSFITWVNGGFKQPTMPKVTDDFVDKIVGNLKIDETYAEKLNEKYQDIFSLTSDTVQASDLDKINEFLNDYEKLPEKVKPQFKDTAAKLNELKKQLETPTPPEDTSDQEFKQNNAEILAKTPETVTVADKDAVEKALNEYNGLSPEAQAKLTAEKANLDKLQAKIAEQEAQEAQDAEVAKFKSDNADALAKTPETVKVSDKAAVEKALNEYNGLSPEAQANLTAEKANLDKLQAKIAEQEAQDAEVAKFKSKNADVLAKTPETVKVSDKAAVEKALNEYNGLSPEAQAKLTDEKANLDKLQAKIAEQEAQDAEVSKFKSENADVLAKTPETVKVSDKAAVEKALNEYNGLSPEAQAKLTAEKANLDKLQAKIAEQEAQDAEVAKFKSENADALAKTPETVKVSDKAAVEKALNEYNGLSPEAQAKLTDEKANLDKLQAKIAEQEAQDAEVSKFKSENADALAKTPETVKVSDKAAVEKALNEYNGLSPEVQAKLTDEKANLDKLQAKIAEQEAQEAQDAEVAKFKSENADALAKTPETVKVSDKAAVEKALNEYNGLSPEVQAKLTDEKANLDKLQAKIAEQEAQDAEVAKFKSENADALAKTPETVKVSDKAAVEKALNEYNGLSPEVQAKLTDEKANLDKLQAKIAEQEAQDAEVAKFKSENADALAKTPETVKVSDKAAVEKALNEYNGLSPEAQAKLTDEKANLDKLQAKIAEQEAQDAEVAKFKSENADALAKTPETVKVSDKAAVEKALNEYNGLSPEVQAKLTDEKANLDKLQAKIAEQEAQDKEVAKFKSDNAEVLAKTPETVTVADKDAVEKALADYAKLSPASQAKLTDEKANLDKLQAKIAEQEAQDKEVAKFKSDNAEVLAKTPETVTVSDKAAVEKALNEYNALSPASQAKLTDEKANLDKLQAKIAAQEAQDKEVAKFKSDNAEVLAKTPETVTVADKDAVEKALADYAKLSPASQAKLTDEKANLDKLQATIAAQEAQDKEVAKFKSENADALAKTPETVTVADKAAVEKALADYAKLSPASQAKLTAEKANLDKLQATIAEQEAQDKEVAKFKSENADALAKTPETVTVADKAAVEKALADYAKLSAASQAKLTDEKANLDKLQATIAAQEAQDKEVAKFKSENADALAKTPETVTVADKAAVEKALADYAKLSPASQAKLTDEKANLDKLQAKIAAQEAQDKEVAKFKSENADALAKTPETVTVADKAAVEKALADYAKLSAASQAKLTAEKANLDKLQAKIAAQEAQDKEVAKFKSENADALAKTPETVTVADKAAVEKALADYAKLSAASQAKLTAEKANLDALKAKIAAQEAQDKEVAKFKSDNAEVLAKTLETVKVSDKAAVEKALADYAKLSPASQAKLTAEKANLDALKAKIAELEAQDKEVAGFKKDHAEVLAKTPETVTVADKDAVEKALADYAKLSAASQAKLTAEKANLDALKAKIAELEAQDKEVAGFKKDHAEVLAKTPETVTVADKAAVEKALADYAKLSPASQAKLTAEKANLDALKAKIAELEAQDKEVAGFKKDHAEVLAKTPETVTVSDKAAVEKALADYAKVSPASQAKLTAEKANLDALKAKIAELEAQDKEVAKFKSDNAEVLAKTPETVTVADKDAVEKALADYAKVSPASQAKLTSEKTKLEAMKVKLKSLRKNHVNVSTNTNQNFEKGNKTLPKAGLTDPQYAGVLGLMMSSLGSFFALKRKKEEN